MNRLSLIVVLLVFSWNVGYSQTISSDSTSVSKINLELLQQIKQLEREVELLKQQTQSFDRILSAVESISNKVITYLTVFITLFTNGVGIVGYVNINNLRRELKQIRKLKSRVIESEGNALRSLFEYAENPTIRFIWGTRYAYWFFKERSNISDIIIRIKEPSELLKKIVKEDDVKRFNDFKKEGMEKVNEMMQSKHKLIRDEAENLYDKIKKFENSRL
jgi:hypothetical protein